MKESFPPTLQGAEGRASVISYTAACSSGTTGYVAQGQTQDNAVHAVHALSDKQKDPCFHCGSKEHFVAKCPSRSNGLSPSACTSALEGNRVQVQEEDEPEDPGAGQINASCRH